MRVLLFSNDLMPFGELPTSGGGLRCWQLKKGLEAHGIEVISSMPGFTYLAEKYADKIPEEERKWLWRWETQDEILSRSKATAVLFASNWDHFGLSKKPEIPLIVDLHGSRLIETTMWNDPVDTDRKVSILAKADCLLCAGRRQRSYFYGWLVQAGRVPESEHFIRYIPISLSPDIPPHDYPKQSDPKAPVFVSGGGWFPWQNQSTAIFSVCSAVAERRRGSVHIFGTPHDDQGRSAEERQIREIYNQVRSMSEKCENIHVGGYIGRSELLEVYSKASVAVEAMRYNLERELAFTTRTIEYLWCGLPVLYNNFSEVGEHISEYDAGWTVDPESESEVVEAIEEIFSDAELVAQKGANAQRLVRDRFTWDKTIIPLIEFLQNPARASFVEPAVGPICPRSSFLNPKGTRVEVPLPFDGSAVLQRFVLPAENIQSIEVPFALTSAESRDRLLQLRLRLLRPNGRQLAVRKFSSSEVPLNAMVSISLPWWRSPRGGTEHILEICCEGKEAESKKDEAAGSNEVLATLGGLIERQYPYLNSDTKYTGTSLLGNEAPVGSLALSFLPGSGRVYQIRSIAERVYWMARNGQWKRIWMAGRRRLPLVVQRLRHALER